MADAEKKLSEEMAAKKAEEAKPRRAGSVLSRRWRAKAAVREQAQALKAQEALIEEGRRARRPGEGDPLELLKANGWEWDDVVAHLTGQKRDPSKAPAPKVNDEIAQLRAEVMAMKAEKQQAALMDTISKAIETSEFRFVKELATPAGLRRVRRLPPAERRAARSRDFQASVALVLEAAETNLKGTAERFKKVMGLTSAPTSASVGGAAAKGDVNRSSELSSNTLSNSLDGAPAPPPKPRSPRPRGVPRCGTPGTRQRAEAVTGQPKALPSKGSATCRSPLPISRTLSRPCTRSRGFRTSFTKDHPLLAMVPKDKEFYGANMAMAVRYANPRAARLRSAPRRPTWATTRACSSS